MIMMSVLKTWNSERAGHPGAAPRKPPRLLRLTDAPVRPGRGGPLPNESAGRGGRKWPDSPAAGPGVPATEPKYEACAGDRQHDERR